MQSYQLTVFDVDISFRANADAKRIEEARIFVEERYERLKNRGGLVGKDQLLTLLILGVADDLLQVQQEKAELEERMAKLLKRIEERE